MAGFKVTLSEKEAKEIGRALTPPMDVKTFGKLSGGHSGSIYYLEAKDGYRLVVNVGEADEFERFKQLHAGMDLLVKHGASLARPLAAVGIIEVDGNPKSYRVTEFIKGKQINNFTVDQVVELAKQLANIHASTGDFVREHGWMPPKMNMLGQFTPANIETKYQKAKASAKQDEIFSDVLDKAHNELLEASRQHRTGLPVGLRHGDFKGKNLVYKNDNTPIIIDWEHMDCGTLLSEIAFVLCEVAYTGNRFDQKKADAFLEAYNQVRPLRNTEIEALPEWLENASKLHNLIRGIGMGIKFADDKVMPLPSPHDRLVMHKSLEQYTKSTDFSWLVEDNRGIPYEQADKYRRKPKVMIWVESRSGAGHIHRVASSAKELTRNGYDVHVVTSSIQYVKQAGLDKFANIIELPGFLTDQPDYKGSREQKELDEELTVYRTNPLEDISWQQERKNLIINALKDVQPDVFITEEYPMTRHPVYTPELEGALKFIHSNESTLENRPLVFCMIKDIALATNPMIKDPAGGTPETASAVVDKYYDHIYVKGDESVVPIWRTAPYLSKFKDKITHVGYMAHAMDTQRNINIPEQDRDVVIATGGSFDADAMELVKKSIKAHGITKHLSQNPWTIYIAKDCPADEFGAIQRLAETEGGKDASGDPNIRVVRNGPEFKQAYANAAASVIRCGYNTVNEAIYHGVPSVVIPRPTSLEQNLRAEVFCDISAGRMQQLHNNDDEYALAAALDRAYVNMNKITCLPEYGTDGYEKALANSFAMRDVKQFPAEHNFIREVSMKTINNNGIRRYQVRVVFDNFTNMHASAMSLYKTLDNMETRFDEEVKGWVYEGKKEVPVARRRKHDVEYDTRYCDVKVSCINHAYPEQGPSGGGTMLVESEDEVFSAQLAHSMASSGGYVQSKKHFTVSQRM